MDHGGPYMKTRKKLQKDCTEWSHKNEQEQLEDNMQTYRNTYTQPKTRSQGTVPELINVQRKILEYEKRTMVKYRASMGQRE